MKGTLKTTGIGLPRKLEEKELDCRLRPRPLVCRTKRVRGEVGEGEFVLIEPIIWSENCPLALMEYFR